MQELGLQRAYTEDDAVYKYIRKFMALSFLPHRQISPMFLCLQSEAQTEPLLRPSEPGSSTTSDNSGLKEQCSFQKTGASTSRQSEQTTMSRDGLPLYSLIELLDGEARLTAVTIRLVSDTGKVENLQSM